MFPHILRAKTVRPTQILYVPQDRDDSRLFRADFLSNPTFRLQTLRKSRVGQIRPVWGKLIRQTAQLLGRSVRILTGEPPKLNFRDQISGFLSDFWVSGSRIS